MPILPGSSLIPVILPVLANPGYISRKSKLMFGRSGFRRVSGGTGIREAILLGFLILFLETGGIAQPWPVQKAWQWYRKQGWLVGANFIPSTAINQLEMWQAPTFDTLTIDQELGYAEGIGMNCMRVFLHHAVWLEDPGAFKNRIRTFLAIAERHHIRIIFVFFDDCWNPVFHTGIQPTPRPGIHNSGWVQDPGRLLFGEPLLKDTLEQYVTDILLTFGRDPRILFWDLYNEPAVHPEDGGTFRLLQAVFRWARKAGPGQPVSVGYYGNSPELARINSFILSHSDIITYHCYDDPEGHLSRIHELEKEGRPLVCTEYMARKLHSTFFEILPLLKSRGIGAINWGLVDGKTQTKYAWDDPVPDGSDPKIWFHDIFRKDGTPYDLEETRFIRKETRR